MDAKNKEEKKLLPQQIIFLDNYFTNNFNGTRAAISAGYSEKNARNTSTALLKDPLIREEISRRLALTRKSKEELRDIVLELWTDVSMVTIDMFIDKVIKTGPKAGTIKWKDIKDWTPAMKKAVSGFKYDRFGTMTIELSGKQWAADSLAKHLGIYVDDSDKDKKKTANVVIMLPDNGRKVVDSEKK